MRRKEREVTNFSQLVDIISRCEVLRLAMTDGHRAYVIPLCFGYRQNGEQLELYFHCATEGKKLDLLRENDQVCFEMDRVLALSKSESPCSWTMRYESIIGSGQVIFLTNVAERRAALDCIMHHYGFQGIPDYVPAAIQKMLLCKILVQELRGKRSL